MSPLACTIFLARWFWRGKSAQFHSLFATLSGWWRGPLWLAHSGWPKQSNEFQSLGASKIIVIQHWKLKYSHDHEIVSSSPIETCSHRMCGFNPYTPLFGDSSNCHIEMCLEWFDLWFKFQRCKLEWYAKRVVSKFQQRRCTWKSKWKNMQN